MVRAITACTATVHSLLLSLFVSSDCQPEVSDSLLGRCALSSHAVPPMLVTVASVPTVGCLAGILQTEIPPRALCFQWYCKNTSWCQVPPTNSSIVKLHRSGRTWSTKSLGRPAATVVGALCISPARSSRQGADGYPDKAAMLRSNHGSVLLAWHTYSPMRPWLLRQVELG